MSLHKLPKKLLSYWHINYLFLTKGYKYSPYNLLHIRNSLKNQWPDILNSLTFTCWLPVLLVKANNIAYDTNIQCNQQYEGHKIKIWSHKSRHITLPRFVKIRGVCSRCILNKGSISPLSEWCIFEMLEYQ
jgi:hypothetical protein